MMSKTSAEAATPVAWKLPDGELLHAEDGNDFWRIGGTPLYTAAPQASQSIRQPEADAYNRKLRQQLEQEWDEVRALKWANSQPVSGAMTDDDISDLIAIAQYLQTVKHWEAHGGSKRLAEIAKKLLSASGQAGQKAVRDAALEEAAAFCESKQDWTYEPRHLAEDIRAMKSTPAQQTEAPVNVPSGWKLVPHEPTAEMRSEGADMMWDRKGTSVDVWQAMWHAAPAPVQTEAQQSEKDAELCRLRKIAFLIGSIFVHGSFKAETYNERELEKLLREQGTFFETLAEFDAAIAQEKANQKGGA